MTGERKDREAEQTRAAPSAGAGQAPSKSGPTNQGRPDLLPALSLPKGGGAIRGIGEKVSVNPATGTGSLTIPIALSPGRNGTGPSLELSYDSGAGNGPFGLGWRLSVPAVSRKTDKGLPRYLDGGPDEDVFVLSGAEDLVPVRVPDGPGDFRVERFRPRTEGLFARIERWTHRTTGDAHWRSVTRENVASVYGLTAQARIADPDDPRRVFSWLLEETRDDRGNLTSYVYKGEDGAGVDPGRLSEASRFDRAGDGTPVFRSTAQRYLKRVLYGNLQPGIAEEPADWLFETVFDYGEHDAVTPTPSAGPAWPVRSDPFSSFRAGFEVRTWRLCRRVLLFHRFAELGATPCLVRSTDFLHQEGPDLTHLVSVVQAGYERDVVTDLYERKAAPPLDLAYMPFELHDELAVLDRDSLEGIPGGVGGGAVQWVDLDGEGLPGVLTEVKGTWFYKANRGRGELEPPRLVARTPAPADLTGVQQLLDLDSDGRLDLASFTPPLAGYFTRTEDEDWTPFEPFSSLPQLDWRDHNLRFVDLDGDGLSDVLLTEDDVFTWYPSRGKGGFGEAVRIRREQDEDRGPAVVFADGTESIQLADLSGDGLVDLVRVRNGEVCYWPNLGYGRFGRKVTLEGSPRFDTPDRFDPRRIRFADVDGSGSSDVFYLALDRIAFWSNQAGNGFGERREIRSLPPVDGFSSIGVVDLLGQGTACLVWSSPLPADVGRPVAYVDLTGGVKPHLLRAVVNNLGAETRLGWAPSTRFYLEDKHAGRPWLTRLHFPVHVVERMERYDGVTQARTVTTYRYRHGYWDGVERELGGFAFVEQRDAEAFGVPAGGGLFPEAPEVEPDLRLPPVVTRTWFHTGAWWDYQRLERELAREHYGLDVEAPRLPDTIVPSGLTADEEREAARALRGKMLRQEVYAEDGEIAGSASLHPYTVSERSYEVVPLQRRDGERHAVFFAHPRETLSLCYERRPDDPRTGHEMVLAVDGFGNVTRSARLGYPRRAPAEAEQGRRWITVEEHDFANRPAEADWYRVGVPTASRTWELTGLPAPAAGLVNRAALDAAFLGAADVPYENPGTGAGAGAVERRLVEAERRLYYRDDLAGALPPGTIDSRALPFETYRLAFTPGLLAAVYGGHVSAADLPALLADHGRYVQQDGLWWAPSGRVIFDAAHFFLPVEAVDPFNQTHWVTWDSYSLLVSETRDPLGNVTAAGNDYRVLAPAQTTDPNGNRTAVRFDPLGMVVATAVMGKMGAGEGDTLADPTTRLEYDLDRWRLHRSPAFVHTFARERHGAANPRWQESYSYSDGGGHEVMKKVQAEPGLAPSRDAAGRLIRDGAGHLVLAHTADRWVGTGRTVLDNKGNPVKKYEPFFSSTPGYEDEADLVEWGVTPVFRYDPLGRLVRTDFPDGTYSQVIFDAWLQENWDQNDTVADSAWLADRLALPAGEPERHAAEKAAAHAGTPTVAHLDALGRPFLTLADNGPDPALPDRHVLFATRVELDVEGNQRSVLDARDRVVMRYDYDMLGNRIHQASMEAGERWMLNDVAGNPIRAWDSRGFQRRTTYDELRRPTHLHVAEGGVERLAEQTVYGESQGAATNHRTRVFQLFDGAGIVTSVAYDFKGNLLESWRDLLPEYRRAVNWLVDSAAGGDRFTSRTTYDALNRPLTATSPDGSVYRPTFNEANLLDRVEVHLHGAEEATSFVTNIDYDAKGQRTHIAYGNRVFTTYTYDPLTFRLVHLRTRRNAERFDSTDRPGEMQNLRYTYDPVGNITHIRDDAQQTIYFDNRRVEPSADYTYDAVYRLIEATGREHLGQGGAPIPHSYNDAGRAGLLSADAAGLFSPSDGNAMALYRERYVYDAVGNFLSMQHWTSGPDPGWTRDYTYDEPSLLEGGKVNNRLTSTAIGELIETYSTLGDGYDAHGSMLRMPHLQEMQWDFKDQLQMTRRQAVNADDADGMEHQGERTWYVYDSAGQRVRKVTELAAGQVKDERIYLGGFEIYRRNGANPLVRETLHIMDDKQRIALVEIRTEGSEPGVPAQLIRYQLGNHLGSASLELDDQAQIISYEEYTPYGSTSYQAVRSQTETPKRYRYTGMERDEETGLNYHTARYYAPWLARWTAGDPLGLLDGINHYVYVRQDPLNGADVSGKQRHDPLADTPSDTAPLAPDTVGGVVAETPIPTIVYDFEDELVIGVRPSLDTAETLPVAGTDVELPTEHSPLETDLLPRAGPESYDEDRVERIIARAWDTAMAEQGEEAGEGVRVDISVLERAYDFISERRNSTPTASLDLSLAAADRYFHGRLIGAGVDFPADAPDIIVGFRDLGFAAGLIIQDVIKILFGSESMPRTGSGPPSPPDARVTAWGYFGLSVGIYDFYQPRTE